MFGHKHKIIHVCTLFGPLKMWKGLVIGGEMTKNLWKVEYQPKKKGFGFGGAMGWFAESHIWARKN
jgi:hypothetical protein